MIFLVHPSLIQKRFLLTVKNDFQHRFKEPPLLHQSQRYGVCSIGHLIVPIKAFPRVVPLRYLLLKMVLSGTVAIREPPLKIYFQAPVNLISMVVAVLQPLFETVFPTMAMEMQLLLFFCFSCNRSLKLFFQRWLWKCNHFYFFCFRGSWLK